MASDVAPTGRECVTGADRLHAMRPSFRLRGLVLRAIAPVFLALLLTACPAIRIQAPVLAGPGAPDLAFLNELEERTFRWFWEVTPANGLVPDRWPTLTFSSVAAIGFGLTAYPIGAERGWVTRAQAADRVLTTLRFLYQLPQGPERTGVAGYNGFFYHFLEFETGHRFKEVELSTIDTALLLGGVLFCQSYFDGESETEAGIRAYADSLYRRVDWRWAQARPPYVSMGWYPESGFHGWDWKGYNEAMLLYILALGSPTHAVEPAAWQAWTSTYKWETFQGQEFLQFAPLFGHQYSHLWIDFRGIRDAYMRARGIDYFENSRRAVLSQRAYAIRNPEGWRGYDANVWGLTASDGPADTTLMWNGKLRTFHTYFARGAGGDEINDDGTLVPTATGGSVTFAPEITTAALKAMRDRYGEVLYGQYGFLDAFNPTFPLTGARPATGRNVSGIWVDSDYLGIDQGPIVGMIENYRSELVWRHMRRHPAIIRGLRRAGFTGGWLDTAPADGMP